MATMDLPDSTVTMFCKTANKHMHAEKHENVVQAISVMDHQTMRPYSAPSDGKAKTKEIMVGPVVVRVRVATLFKIPPDLTSQ